MVQVTHRIEGTVNTYVSQRFLTVVATHHRISSLVLAAEDKIANGIAVGAHWAIPDGREIPFLNTSWGILGWCSGDRRFSGGGMEPGSWPIFSIESSGGLGGRMSCSLVP